MTRRVITRWKKTVRRRLAIGGAALTIGVLILFVAQVLPASAHSALLSGRTVCANGDHVITWSIGNDWTGPLTVQSANARMGSTSYAVTGYSATVAPQAHTSATTIVPGPTTGNVTLTVTAVWDDGFRRTESTSVALIGPCMGGSSSTTTTTIPVTVPPTTAPPTTTPPTTAPATTVPVTTQGSTVPAPTTTAPEATTVPDTITVPETTPPTTAATTTTVEETTSTTVISQGSTIAPPTTVLSQGSTVAPPDTQGQTPTTGTGSENTPVTAAGGPSGPGAGGSSNTERLPFTGMSGFGPMVGLGALVLGGIAVAVGSRKRRMQRS